MKIKRNILFPSILLVVIISMTALAIPILAGKNALNQSWSQKHKPVSTPSSGGVGSGILPDTGLQGQVAQAAVTDCTYHYYYWKSHPELWPDQVTIGALSYTKQQANALFQSNIGIDPSAAGNSPTQFLTLQAYITTLNIKQGASQFEIQQTLTDATNWLANHVNNNSNSEFDNSVGINLAQNLEDYNNGFSGPGLCPNQPPLPKITATATIVPSPTQGQTPTPIRKRIIQQPKPNAQKQNQNNENSAPQPTTIPPTAVPTQTPLPTATPVPPSAAPIPPTAAPVPPTKAPPPPKDAPPPKEAPPPPPDGPKKPPGKPPKPKPTKKPKGNKGSLGVPILTS